MFGEFCGDCRLDVRRAAHTDTDTDTDTDMHTHIRKHITNAHKYTHTAHTHTHARAHTHTHTNNTKQPTSYISARWRGFFFAGGEKKLEKRKKNQQKKPMGERGKGTMTRVFFAIWRQRWPKIETLLHTHPHTRTPTPTPTHTMSAGTGIPKESHVWMKAYGFHICVTNSYPHTCVDYEFVTHIWNPYAYRLGASCLSNTYEWVKCRCNSRPTTTWRTNCVETVSKLCRNRHCDMTGTLVKRNCAEIESVPE